MFEALWKSGDRTWVPYETIQHLGVLRAYFDALGIDSVADLIEGDGTPPSDPQIFVGNIEPCLEACERRGRRRRAHRRGTKGRGRSVLQSTATHSPSLPPALELLLAPLLHPPIPLSFHTMPFQHAFLDSNAPTLTLFDASGSTIFFAPGQLRAGNAYNIYLREHGTSEGYPFGTPGGYDQLADLWNADEDCPYLFATCDPVSGVVTVRGRPLPSELLDELDPPAPAPAPAPADEPEPQFTPAQEDTINRMLWAAADREAHFAELRSKSRAQRAEERKRKRDDRRPTDTAAASSGKRSRIEGSAGVRASTRSSGGSGSSAALRKQTQTQTQTQTRASASSKVAGPSKPRSSKPSTGRVDEAMDEDEDAEGETEKDDELIEYSEDEDEDEGASKADGKRRAGDKRA